MKFKDFARPFTRVMPRDSERTTIRFALEDSADLTLVNTVYDVEKNEWVINLKQRVLK